MSNDSEERNIVKQLREAEKLGVLKSNIHHSIEDAKLTQRAYDESDDDFFKSTSFIEESQPTTLEFQEEEKLYHSVVELSPDGIFVLDLKGIVRSCNASAVKLLGYPKEDLIGHKFSDIGKYDMKEIATYLKIFHSIIRGKIVDPFEIDIRRKDKTVFTAEIRVGLLTQNGKKTGIQAIVRNISDKKTQKERIKKSEKELRDFFDNANDLIQSVDANGFFKFVNKKWKEVLEYSDEEIKKLHFTDILQKDYISHCETIFKKLSKGESFKDVQVVFKTKSGKDIYVSGNINAYIVDGELISTRGIFRDVTEQRNSLMALEKSEKKYKTLFENLNEAAYMMSLPDGTYEYFNPAAKEVFGYSADDFLNHPRMIQQMIHPDFKGFFINAWNDLLKGIVPKTFEYKIIDPEQNERWILQSNQGIFDEEGNIIAVEGICRNITERKAAEKNIRESEKKLRQITENLTDVVFTTDLNLNTTYVSPSVEKMLDEPPQIYIKKDLEEKHPPASIQKIQAVLNEELEKEKDPSIDKNRSRIIELEHYTSDGNIINISMHLSFIRDEQGKPIGIQGLTRDITEEKTLKKKLTKQHDKLLAIFNNMDEVVYISDPETYNILYLNESGSKKWGNDWEGKKCYKILQNRDKPCPFCTNQKIFANPGETYIWNFQNEMNNHWYRCIDKAIDWIDDKKVRFEMAIDITDLKKAEEKIMKSEENFRTFFETMDDPIFIGNQKGKIIFTNSASSKKLGYSLEELKKMNIADVHPQKHRNEAEKIFAEMIEGKRNMCQLPLQKKDGTYLPVETRVWSGIWDGVECIFGISKDISTQQAALDTFYKMFDNNPALMAVSSLTDKRFVKINEAFSEKLGYSPEEIIGRTSEELDLFVEPEKQRYISNLLAKHGRIKNIELEVRRKDKTIITGLFSGEIIDNQKEKSFLTVMTDITLQKRAKKELQEKIDTLERYKKVTVDRELKMVELKKENKKLKKELNESGH